MLYAEDADSVWLRMDDMRNLEYETSAVEVIESLRKGSRQTDSESIRIRARSLL